jgi:hypothetical protein
VKSNAGWFARPAAFQGVETVRFTVTADGASGTPS